MSPKSAVAIRAARPEDAAGVAACVCEAYVHYIERIGVGGVGRLLLELAESEAHRQGHASIYLATHELMTENRALYSRAGYVEYDSRVVSGYPRVFFRKALIP